LRFHIAAQTSFPDPAACGLTLPMSRTARLSGRADDLKISAGRSWSGRNEVLSCDHLWDRPGGKAATCDHGPRSVPSYSRHERSTKHACMKWLSIIAPHSSHFLRPMVKSAPKRIRKAGDNWSMHWVDASETFVIYDWVSKLVDSPHIIMQRHRLKILHESITSPDRRRHALLTAK
jgi:hypothetical protein